MSRDNVIDLVRRRNGTFGENPPLPPPPQGLPQDEYLFHLVDKIDGSEVSYRKTGHLVVTQHNIVLFDAQQNMIWGIPNDEAVIMFEKVQQLEQEEDSEDQLTFELDLDEVPSV